MNGPEHYAEAERLLGLVGDMQVDPRDPIIVASAQVHATLALTAVLLADVPVGNATDAVWAAWEAAGAL